MTIRHRQTIALFCPSCDTKAIAEVSGDEDLHWMIKNFRVDAISEGFEASYGTTLMNTVFRCSACQVEARPKVDPEGVVLMEQAGMERIVDWLVGYMGSVPRHWVELVRTSTPRQLEPLTKFMRAGEELWICRSRWYQPEQLIGGVGVARVRDGKVVDWEVLIQH